VPESLARSVADEPGVAAFAKIKLLVVGGRLVFGLNEREFAYRRMVVVRCGVRGGVMVGKG
jgi:hypothetical protein